MTHRIAYVIRTSKRIAPFDDDVGEVLINQRRLRDRQEEALKQLGFMVQHIDSRIDILVDNYPCLLLADDLYLDQATLSEFLNLADRSAVSVQGAISKNTAFCKIFTPFQDEESDKCARFPLYYLRGPQSKDIQQVTIDIGERKMPFYIPPHMRGSAEIVLPACLRPIMQINHAVDVLFANVACLHVRFAALLDSSAQRMLLAIRQRSFKPARVLRGMNRIGSGCDIHPTAWLEGVEIGNNVQIGANAVIRMSNIGDGCQIGDGSVVKHSVVGNGSVLFDDLTLGFAVCYPETFLIHGPYHLSVFGKSSAMFATILDDFRLDGKPIRFEMNGRLVEHPFPFLGSFVGHRTRVAGGSIIAPGRSIPNDLLIFPAPEGVLSRVRDDTPKRVPVFIKDGGLERLTERPSAAPVPDGSLRKAG